MGGDLFLKIYVTFLLYLIGGNHSITAQNNQYHWTKIHHFYENMEENNANALPYVQMKIKDLKKVKNTKELFYTYEDAVYFSNKTDDKQAFADSAITAARSTKSNQLITKAYTGKGTIYFFHTRDYKKALENYQTALQYAEKQKNTYLLNKLHYHIAVCKAALGYKDEAEQTLKTTTLFFETNRNKATSSPEFYNHSRGYLNSLHQLLIIYNDKRNPKKVDSILKLKALNEIQQSSDFKQEKAYFEKERGIQLYHKKQFQKAISKFIIADQTISAKMDLASQTRLLYFLSQSHNSLGQNQQAFYYAKKMDSLCFANNFFPLELHANYKFLIHQAANEQNHKLTKLWSNKLMKVDSALATSTPALAKTIWNLNNESLKKENHKKMAHNIGLGILTITLLGGLTIGAIMVGRRNKTKNVNSTTQNTGRNEKTHPLKERKNEFSKEIVDTILDNLTAFESSQGFLTKNLTLTKLATKLNTNTTHLSYVLNGVKKQNFSNYIKELRINYITNLLKSNPKFLNYTIEALSQTAGMSSRQVFSDHFFEVNGVRPIDFINQLKRENETN